LSFFISPQILVSILFIGDNHKEQLELNPSQIDYITSQDNYFEVVWKEREKVNKKLLRGTLTKVEEKN